MTSYTWLITKDNIDTGALGIEGPRDGDQSLKDRSKCERFRLLDDDGEIYYYGKIWGEYDGFEPLDDFGTPNAGCTAIQYRTDSNVWETL